MKRFLCMGLLLLGAHAFAAPSNGKLINVDQLNQLLKAKKAGWVAKDNDLNARSLSQVKAMMGSRKVRQGVRFHLPANHAMATHAVPAVVDWRDNSGNWVTPVLDQGYCGSCVTFATIATLETQYRISSGLSLFNIRLSPQYLMDCGGGSCDGWEVDGAAQFVQSNGVPAESCFPYMSGAAGADSTCSAACPNAAQTLVRAASYTSPTQGAWDIDALKAALQKGPLAADLDVYADFMLYSSGVYKHTTGDYLGGHAVSIVGYDDNQQALIIRNSWGTGWGENGFAYMAYDDVSGIGDDTWAFSMPSLAGGVSVESPLDYSYYTGTATVKADSTYSGTDSISLSFFDSNSKAVWTGSCASSTCSTTANIANLADGTYTVQGMAMDAKGNQLGQSFLQKFYVANSKPTLTLSFAGTQGTDLTQTVTGDAMIQVTASSSDQVPLNLLEFHYKGSTGTEIVRTSALVANGMLLDWGTQLHPNDKYEVWMVGHLTTNAFDATVETTHIFVQTQN